ncbi:thioredoxin family protein [Poseidonibacter lekithochrous]|uniref:thioredoxin family protein n=1 Tax=Poseidonibacter TaxID=2321187 RepID=UPI001C09F4E2|nr:MULTISPECIES: thioredoxin family protein [Poseidonibacter]MBU3015319.1 thioredoxin family protein [Poseidonibacter lekithochrous]MDO6828616.1 thioredoxin family protein [Poseidonibacter sp. 1_MG-2023]
MKQAKTLIEVENIINTGNPVLIYFSGENCSVCKVLKPKIEEEISKNFPLFDLIEVQTDLHKEITSHFTVFSIPTMLIFLDKKEFFRRGRNISVSMFMEEIRRPYNLMTK